MILSVEVLAVDNVDCICCRMLGSISSWPRRQLGVFSVSLSEASCMGDEKIIPICTG